MAKEQDQPIKRVELKVSVNCCDGCRSKVLKALNIKAFAVTILSAMHHAGVLRTEVHPTAGRVAVVGDVDADRLVKRLAKVGKIAEVIPQPPPEAEKKAKHGGGGDKNGENAGGTNGDGVKAAVGFHRAEAPPAMTTTAYGFGGCYYGIPSPPPALVCRGPILVVRPEPTRFIDEGGLYGGDDDTAGCHVM